MIRLLTGFLLLGAVQPLLGQTRHEFTELHMGVAVRLVLHAPDTATARRAARAAYDRIAALEDVFSDYRPQSELRRLAGRPGEPISVSADLLAVLQVALRVAAATDGAFDPPPPLSSASGGIRGAPGNSPGPRRSTPPASWSGGVNCCSTPPAPRSSSTTPASAWTWAGSPRASSSARPSTSSGGTAPPPH